MDSNMEIDGVNDGNGCHSGTIDSIPCGLDSERLSEGVSLKKVSSEFIRGNGEDYKAMNAIWGRVSESLSRFGMAKETGSAVIRQRVFLLLCSEYLRIRSHSERTRDIEIDEFLQFGADAVDSLCKIKVSHFKAFGESMKCRIMTEYDEKMERVRADKVKLTKNRYQYVYSPPAQRMTAH